MNPPPLTILFLGGDIPVELFARLGDLYVYARARGRFRRLWVGRRNDQPLPPMEYDAAGIPIDQTYAGDTVGYDDLLYVQEGNADLADKNALLEWVEGEIREWWSPDAEKK